MLWFIQSSLLRLLVLYVPSTSTVYCMERTPNTRALHSKEDNGFCCIGWIPLLFPCRSYLKNARYPLWTPPGSPHHTTTEAIIWPPLLYCTMDAITRCTVRASSLLCLLNQANVTQLCNLNRSCCLLSLLPLAAGTRGVHHVHTEDLITGNLFFCDQGPAYVHHKHSSLGIGCLSCQTAPHRK